MKIKKILLGVVIFSLFIELFSASDIAYIYRKASEIDNNVLDVFDEMGLSYELINEKNLPDFSDYKIIFVGNERFRNARKIPVTERPSVVMNYYYGKKWGLTDRDGISKLAGNAPLYVKKGSEVVKVYTQAEYSLGKVSIPYYYLSDKNKDSRMQSQARTYIGGDYTFGDVISYSNSGAETCFFGIIESDYWTPSAKQMFKECIESVSVTCSSDYDCGIETSTEPYCTNNDVYQDIESYFCEDSGTCHSQCNRNFEIRLIEDCGEDYCSEWSAYYCYDNDVYHSRTCYEKGCLLGGCFNNEVASQELVENCLNGCSEGNCIIQEPECNDEECLPTECEGLDGCYGSDYYDYYDVENNCLENICSENLCNLFDISYSDERCVEVPVCGNDILETGEECDDGNLIDGDGCSINCEIESGEIHDVSLTEDYDSFGNIIRLKDSDNEIIEDDVPLIQCGLEYDIQFKTINLGDFTEDVDISVTINNSEVVYNDLKTKTGLGFNETTTSGNKNNFIFNFSSGFYTINVEAIIPVDNIPENNFASRQIEVVCN